MPEHDAEAGQRASSGLADLSGGRLSVVARTWKERRAVIRTRFAGESMLPTISSRTDLEIHCGEMPAVGSIVAYERGDQVIVHRVIAIAGMFVIARGDASQIPDPPFGLEKVIGPVRRASTNDREQSLDAPVPGLFTGVLAELVVVLTRVHPAVAGASVRMLWLMRRALLELGGLLRR